TATARPCSSTCSAATTVVRRYGSAARCSSAVPERAGVWRTRPRCARSAATTAACPDLIVTVLSTENLTAEQRSSVVDVCIAAHDNAAFANLFDAIKSGGRHCLAYRGHELVSHAVVTTRWVQPEGVRVLKTAFVDAVATLPAYQGLGYASAVMRRLAA